MIVILDTSVIITIFLSKKSSSSKDILNLAIENKIQLAICKETFEELIYKIKSSKIKKLIGFDQKKISRFIPWYKYNSIVFKLKDYNINTNLRDPNDIIYLNLAIKCKADFLISIDKDLLVLKQIESTTIVSPSEFIKIFNLN